MEKYLKANEVVCGDYILADTPLGGGRVMVTASRGEHVMAIAEGGVIVHLTEGMMKPIELSDAFFSENGFTGGDGRHALIGPFGVNVAEVRRDGDVWYVSFADMLEVRSVRYVHEFQHLLKEAGWERMVIVSASPFRMNSPKH